jgi:hypothetical protein
MLLESYLEDQLRIKSALAASVVELAAATGGGGGRGVAAGAGLSNE